LRPSIKQRSTIPRRAVAELIAEQSGHFTAADLINAARRRGLTVGRATIFRTLDVLADQRALERIDLPSGEHAYVACAPREHHHHVICRSCGKSVEVADAGLRSVVDQIARRSGYAIENHRLEFFGLCPTCQKGPSQ
jgi:Fur family ferric uptake transcriptional regulator